MSAPAFSIEPYCDNLGPENVLHLYEPQSELRAIVVVDNTACGPAIGGVRMAADVSVEEVFRLARAMTLKNAAAGLAHGGGKAGILVDPRGADKPRLVRAFARAILVVPDFIANAGGVICAAVEYHGGSESSAFEQIAQKIRHNTEAVRCRGFGPAAGSGGHDLAPEGMSNADRDTNTRPRPLAIVGFGAIVERSWVVDGKIVLRSLLTATLSADHRVSDGHRGAIFLAAVDRVLLET